MNVKIILANAVAISVASAWTCAAYEMLESHSDAEHLAAPHSDAAHSSAPHSDAQHLNAGHENAPMPDRAAAAIRSYVRTIAAVREAFAVQDNETGRIVVLDLQATGPYTVYRTGPDNYSAAAVFVSNGGATYELDFTLRPVAHDLPRVTGVYIRAVDGVPRYTWREQDGLWVKANVR